MINQKRSPGKTWEGVAAENNLLFEGDRQGGIFYKKLPDGNKGDECGRTIALNSYYLTETAA